MFPRRVAVYYAHYTFARLHSTIKTTSAVAGGLMDRPWTLVEFVEWGGDHAR